jgi:hypothetical protein
MGDRRGNSSGEESSRLRSLFAGLLSEGVSCLGQDNVGGWRRRLSSSKLFNARVRREIMSWSKDASFDNVMSLSSTLALIVFFGLRR